MKRCLLSIMMILFVTACVPATRAIPTTALTVMAAASLTTPFTEIGRQFELQHPGTIVTFNFAGSQELAQQISQDAPTDVFASANRKQMNVVIDNGRINPDAPRTFVKNRLTVIYPIDNPADLHELKDLATPGIKLILAAVEVPVGQYSLQVLELASQNPAYGETFKNSVLQNVVSYESNVKFVLSKVALGEGDAGIVYSSDLQGEDAAKVALIKIPDEINMIAAYPIAPLNDSANPEMAQAFVDYVLSDQGQAVLARYGFMTIDTP